MQKEHLFAQTLQHLIQLLASIQVVRVLKSGEFDLSDLEVRQGSKRAALCCVCVCVSAQCSAFIHNHSAYP